MPSLRLIGFISLFFLISGCSLFQDSYNNKEVIEDFTESLISENYDACVQYLHKDASSLSTDSTELIKNTLRNMHSYVVENFGTAPEYTMLESSRNWSSTSEEAEKYTTTIVQISNDTHYGKVRAIIRNGTKEVYNINYTPSAVKPSLKKFWLFLPILLIVAGLNIFAILRIRRYSYKVKWLKYIGVLLFNLPVMKMTSMAFSIELAMQFMLGIAFKWTGYDTMYMAAGIPLGALYWIWRTSKKQSNPDLEAQIEEVKGYSE